MERKIRRGKYGNRQIFNLILTVHCLELRHFEVQVPYLKTRIWPPFSSLKFWRCYFIPLCKIREHFTDFQSLFLIYGRSQWPRGLRCGSETPRLLVLWVRMPPGAWMFVWCECCGCQVEVFESAYHSPRGAIPTVECVTGCDSKASIKEALEQMGLLRHGKKSLIHLCQGMATVTPAPTYTLTHKIIKTTSIAINMNFSVFKHTC